MKSNPDIRPEVSDKIKALGLSSGGLDSILSALILKKQGIDVTWISFKTPFFDCNAALRASESTGIPLIIEDITDEYLKMLADPPGGYGKNMNPCMDCHALMFSRAGLVMQKRGFNFLFSGEVAGQRPKSQNKNSMRYVEKKSGFDGYILRPLSGGILPQTIAEKKGLWIGKNFCPFQADHEKSRYGWQNNLVLKITLPLPEDVF